MLLCNCHRTLLVEVVVRGHVEVDNVGDVFYHGALGVAAMEHHEDVK